MHSLQESLAAWATILGTVLSLIGLIQSRAWLTIVSLLFLGASIFVGLYARKERLRVDSASLKVEGRSLDSLNIANLRRRVNRSLVVQEADHVARIEGEDLNITLRYAGYCRAEEETTIEFSVDSDNGIPFKALHCFAYDLQCDPGRAHKIQPILVGADGISKKIAVPFIEPLVAQQPFAVLLKCALPGCMKAGFDYYTSTLSFDQDRVARLRVRLLFIGNCPAWVRVYEYGAAGRTRLLKDLRPQREDHEFAEYLDTAEGVPGRSTRIYAFSRVRHRVPQPIMTGQAGHSRGRDQPWVHRTLTST